MSSGIEIVESIFRMALDEIQTGKGAQRHGREDEHILDQPWFRIAKTYGVGFLQGQAAKKLEEAAALYASGEWELERYTQEMLGAMNYIAFAVAYEQIRCTLLAKEVAPQPESTEAA
jgi:hypothetical protein